MDQTETVDLQKETLYLNSRKSVPICDYELPSSNTISSSTAASIYLFDNVTVVEVNGQASTYDGEVLDSCPEKAIYFNDASPRAIKDNGTGFSTQYEYPVKKYTFSTSASACRAANDGKSCNKFSYIGSRDDEKVQNNNKNVCDTIGDDTIQQLKTVVSILQVLVPVLVIALTGLDLFKVVTSGDVEEELKKKKVTFIIRFVVMIVFFFLPLFTKIIITLLQNAGVTDIKNVDCFLEQL